MVQPGDRPPEGTLRATQVSSRARCCTGHSPRAAACTSAANAAADPADTRLRNRYRAAILTTPETCAYVSAMTDSSFVVHFTKGIDAQGKLIGILNDETIRSNSVPWVNRRVVCFTECPWASLLTHVNNYSAFGLGFSKALVFAAGGGPAYYVRHDHWEKQQWDDHVKAFVTPFWPSYRPNTEHYQTPLGGKTVDYSHEREWRVPHDFSFERKRIEFVVLPDYETMAQFPKDHKDAIGRDRFIMVDVYRQIERLWPTHILR